MRTCKWTMGFVCVVAAVTVAGEPPGTGTNASGGVVTQEPVFFTAQMFQQIQQDLRRIESAKAMWAMDGNRGPKEEPTWADVKSFLKGEPPAPPCGGVYVLNNVVTPSEVRISSKDFQQYMARIMKAHKATTRPNQAPEDTARKLADPQR